MYVHASVNRLPIERENVENKRTLTTFVVNLPNNRTFDIPAERTTYHRDGEFLNGQVGDLVSCIYVPISGKIQLWNCTTAELTFPETPSEAVEAQLRLMQKDGAGQSRWIGAIIAIGDVRVARLTVEDLGKILLRIKYEARSEAAVGKAQPPWGVEEYDAIKDKEGPMVANPALTKLSPDDFESDEDRPRITYIGLGNVPGSLTPVT